MTCTTRRKLRRGRGQCAPTDCPTCLRTKEAAEAMAGVVDFMAVMRFLERIDNPAHLKQLAARIEEK